MKAIIPAAGLGTRFLPATKVTPKELLPVLNKPVIQYVVEEALEPDDVDGVVIINSHEKPQIDSYFQHNEILERYLNDRAKNAEAQMVQESESWVMQFIVQLLIPMMSAFLCCQAIILFLIVKCACA